MAAVINFRRVAMIAALLFFTVSDLLGETVKLYFAELLADEKGGQNFQLIHEIKLVDGVVVGSTEIFRFKPTTAMVFDGRCRMINDRYVVSSTGHILDLVDHKILFGDASKYEFLGIQENKAYYRFEKNDISGADRADIFLYDIMKRLGPALVQKPDFYWMTTKGDRDYYGKSYSPSRRKYAVAKNSGSCEIWVNEPTGAKLLCKDMHVSVAEVCSEMPKVPLLWLNDRLLLTQKANGHLVKVDIEGKMSDVLKIKCGSPPLISPRLGRNLDGDIIYSCGESFVVNVEKGTATPYVWKPIGKEFSYSEGSGNEVRFRRGNEEIGVLTSVGYQSEACDGYLATTYGEKGKLGLGYPEGVAIWSVRTREWTRLKFAWVDNIIGFVQD